MVHPDKANDIDILIHEYHEDAAKSALLSKGFYPLGKGDKKYDEIDHVRLIAVYEGHVEGKKYNVIVVGAAFWPAYLGAVAEMRNNPELYTDRDERIALHKGKCREVAAIANITLECAHA